MNETLETEVVPETQAIATRPEAGAVGKALPADQIQAPMTAAQAKVDAVAALTMSAYEKAATLELTPEESAALKADFPDEAFQPGAAGKEHLIYIEHAHLRDRFNSVFGMGKWAIVPRNRWAEPFKTQGYPGKPPVEGSRVYVEAMLVVRGCFVGEAVGAMEYYPHNAAQNYGDAVEGAKTAAFRRCAKEFGIGLQAWKKDWCEGWWQRKRAGQRQQSPGRAAASPPSQRPTQAQAAPATPKGAPPAPAHVPFPTAESRAKMIVALKAGPDAPNRDIVTEYFRKLENPSQLMPGEVLEDLPLRFVPATTGQMKSLSEKLTEFGNGERAAAAFPPHPEPDPPKAGAKAKPIEVPRDPPGPAAPDPTTTGEPWRDIICPIPRKGQKRDEYLRNPDTIGRLYDLRHGSDDEAQAARQRLWGFVHNYELKPWVKNNGEEVPPSAADVKFREALDQFAAWFEHNHPGEKL